VAVTNPVIKLNGIQKAAILLISLGAEYSAKVLKQGFFDEEIEQVTYEVTNMERVSQEVRNKVLEEFSQLKQAREYLIHGGLKYAKEILEKTLGHGKAAEIVKKLIGKSKNIPFGFLEKTDARYLTNFIREEHPQTIAMLLAYLEPEYATQILSTLSPEQQGDVARRIAIMDRALPEMIKEVEQVLEKRLAHTIQEEQTSISGIKTLVDILNMVGRSTEKAILEELEYSDPGLAEEIRKRTFLFEDIIKLDDLSIQRILREVDPKDLSLAIRGAGLEIRECIYRNQSKRSAEMLKEEVEYMGPVRLREVEEAQMKIVKIIRQLDESGEIVISRGGEDAVIM